MKITRTLSGRHAEQHRRGVSQRVDGLRGRPDRGLARPAHRPRRTTLPIDPCIWYGCRYVAFTTVAAPASASSTSFESTSNASRAGLLAQVVVEVALARAARCRPSTSPCSFAAACMACHGFSATTPTKFFLTTTLTKPGQVAYRTSRRR